MGFFSRHGQKGIEKFSRRVTFSFLPLRLLSISFGEKEEKPPKHGKLRKS